MKKYAKEGRLADITTLISLLATDKHTFRKFDSLTASVRANPLSGSKWEDVAADHPEFFRFNGENTHVALLIRSYFMEGENGMRPPLAVDQTQTLISTAMALYDKEILFKQRRAYLIPLYCALIAAIVTIVGLYISQQTLNVAIKKIEDVNKTQLKLLKIADSIIHK